MTGSGPRGLTPRQRQALDAYARIGSQKVAAHELGIAPRTIRWHLAEARGRLGTQTLLEVVALLAEAVAPPAIATAAHLDRVTDDAPGRTIPAMDTTGPALRSARLEAGLSQGQVARRLGLARQRVTTAESAIHVSPDFADRFRGALHNA